MHFYPIFLTKVTGIRGQRWDFGTLLITIMKKSESNEEKEMKRNGKTKPLRNILTETYVFKNLDFLTKIRMRLED